MFTSTNWGREDTLRGLFVLYAILDVAVSCIVEEEHQLLSLFSFSKFFIWYACFLYYIILLRFQYHPGFSFSRSLIFHVIWLILLWFLLISRCSWIIRRPICLIRYFPVLMGDWMLYIFNFWFSFIWVIWFCSISLYRVAAWLLLASSSRSVVEFLTSLALMRYTSTVHKASLKRVFHFLCSCLFV